jgi:hypothetical protein
MADQGDLVVVLDRAGRVSLEDVADANHTEDMQLGRPQRAHAALPKT